ncbi:DNA methylase [Glycomyces sp. NPDC021274]|uniref:DNA methylase n=1 Tax=Glycomyces sp. NPDC021274 TaxID=3155120 RepID=UPI0033C3ECED
MRKPRLLDLYSCAGGAARGYADAGFEVVGVDINPQPNYPFEFHQADAIEYVTEHGHEFDAIHASPPCQAHTTLTKGNRPRGIGKAHVDLIPATRDALEAVGRPYVIENVTSAPIRADVVLCGLMFGLNVFRHRLFELGGWAMLSPAHPTHIGHRVAGWRHGVKHDGDMFAVYGDGGGKGSVQEWQQAMGIDWTTDRSELAEAIPPAYTRFIGAQLLQHLEANTFNQGGRADER